MGNVDAATFLNLLCNADYHAQPIFKKFPLWTIELTVPWGTYREQSTSYGKAKDAAAVSALLDLARMYSHGEPTDRAVLAFLGAVYGEDWQGPDAILQNPLVRGVRICGPFGPLYAPILPGGLALAPFRHTIRRFLHAIPETATPPLSAHLSPAEQSTALNLLSHALYRRSPDVRSDGVHLPGLTLPNPGAVGQALTYLLREIYMFLGGPDEVDCVTGAPGPNFGYSK